MSNKQVRTGKVFTLTAATGGATVNSVHVMTGMIGINLETVTGGALQPVAVEGVWNLPKTAGQAYTVGQKLYCTATGVLHSTATGTNVAAGFAETAAATGDSRANVKLSPF